MKTTNADEAPPTAEGKVSAGRNDQNSMTRYPTTTTTIHIDDNKREYNIL